MLENLTFQSVCQVSASGPFPSTSKDLLPKCWAFHSDPHFQAMFFLLVTRGAAKLFTLCCHRRFLNRGKAPTSEVFIVICPHLLLEAALVLSGQKPRLWCAPCPYSMKLRSLQVLSPLPCSLPHVLHGTPCCSGERERETTSQTEETRRPGGDKAKCYSRSVPHSLVRTLHCSTALHHPLPDSHFPAFPCCYHLATSAKGTCTNRRLLVEHQSQGDCPG